MLCTGPVNGLLGKGLQPGVDSRRNYAQELSATMLTKRFATRSAAIAAACGIAGLATAGIASAHVTANPHEIEKGGYAKIAFRVPNERPNTGTVKLKVELPLDHPVKTASTKPMAGWTAQVEKVKLDKPVQSNGTQVNEAVKSITWTAEPGTRIATEQFQEFETSLGSVPTDADQLVMPAEQTYDNGEVVKWDTPQTPGTPEPEHPAPTVTLVDGVEGGHKHGSAAHMNMHHTAGQEGPNFQDDTARWLGGAGLLAGALGIGFGAGAMLRGRKGQS